MDSYASLISSWFAVVQYVSFFILSEPSNARKGWMLFIDMRVVGCMGVVRMEVDVMELLFVGTTRIISVEK